MIRATKGRGAGENSSGRFESLERESVDDGWGSLDEDEDRLKTTLSVDHSRTVISFNKSPDLPFDRSVNPYRGCEHGCIYCYARPSHAYLGLSPGLDFESRIFYKADAAACLRRELARPGYRCAPIMLGANTDAYQPAERALKVTREILELLANCDHPVRIITTTNTTPDAAGDLVQGTRGAFFAATGVVLGKVAAGKAVKCKVAQATAGTPAGKVKVRCWVSELT